MLNKIFKKKRSKLFVIQSDHGFKKDSTVGNRTDLELDVSDESFGKYTKHDSIGSSIDRKKVGWFIVLISATLLIFSFKTAQLQIIQGDHYKKLADRNRYREARVIPPRGMIFDNNGKILAKNIPAFILTMTISDLPEDTKRRSHVINRLTKLTGLQRADIDLAITDFINNPNDPIPLKKHLSYEIAMKLAIETSSLDGFDLEIGSQRKYPLNAQSLSHILGYTGTMSLDDLENSDGEYKPIDTIGKTGIEKIAESILRGIPGTVVTEVDAIGKNLSVISKIKRTDGSNITLSINSNFQEYIESRMLNLFTRVGATRGSVIALNPQTGSVKALVSLPAYNNNDFTNGIKIDEYEKLLNNPDRPLFNRAISGEFPSGSTFKPFIAYAALTEGIIKEHSSFISTGGIRINEWFFPDWKTGGHGVTDVRKAISESVNTFFYILGGGYNKVTGLGVKKISEYARMFGFGEQTGINLPAESDGFLPSKEWKREVKKERWYVGDTYHLAIGQGDFLTTPLQMAIATSVIANGGFKVVPYLIEAVDGSLSDIDLSHQPKVIENINSESIEIVRQGMRQTVTQGSARSLNTLSQSIAGKTGTAQAPGDKPYYSWFSGFAPYTDPDLTLIILIEEGGGSNDAAVPLAKEIFQWWFEKNSK